MSATRARLSRLQLHIPRKHADFETPPSGGSLSPDLQPNTPQPTFPNNDDVHRISKIGKYLLIAPLDSVGSVQIYKAFHSETQEEFICKIAPVNKYRDILTAYWRVGSHEHINEIEEILLGDTHAYVFFAKNYGDLHSYVRTRRKLKEAEAGRLFAQIISAVTHCHENGVVLRDLKLRKFVFKNPERTQLKLESLEEACVLEDEENDRLVDKHGCPAYVSPEILNTNETYSGKAADIWSLGVMLYTMLIGRYPFHDVEPSALFCKIRRGLYSIPDTISSRAKCLVRSLLRHEPSERLKSDEIMQHPWYCLGSRVLGHSKGDSSKKLVDQTVPDIEVTDDDIFFV